MSGSPWTAVGRAFRRWALPLACYYVVTLVIPLAHGPAESGTFVRHALVVLVVPPIAIVLACAARAIAHELASVSQDEVGPPGR